MKPSPPPIRRAPTARRRNLNRRGPRPRRRANNAPSSADLILAAAAVEFSKCGFSGARIELIARRAGVNKALLYYYFRGKAALFNAVLKSLFLGMRDTVAVAARGEASPVERLHRIIIAIAERAAAHPHLPRIMMREVASGAEHLKSDVLSIIAEIFGMIRATLEEGISSGQFRLVDPIKTHIMIIGSIMFYVSGSSVRHKIRKQLPSAPQIDEPPSVLGAHVADLILNGLSLPAPPRRRGGTDTSARAV